MKYFMLYYNDKNENWLGKPTNALIQATDIHQAATITARVLASDFQSVNSRVVGSHNQARVLEIAADNQNPHIAETVTYWLAECQLHTLEETIAS